MSKDALREERLACLHTAPADRYLTQRDDGR